MPKYRKKPVVIDAIQFNGINAQKIFDFFGDKQFDAERIVENYVVVGISIKTLEGTMRADKGDYIIKGVNGEFYPCKEDIFKKTYDKVDNSFSEFDKERDTALGR